MPCLWRDGGPAEDVRSVPMAALWREAMPRLQPQKILGLWHRTGNCRPRCQGPQFCHRLIDALHHLSAERLNYDLQKMEQA